MLGPNARIGPKKKPLKYFRDIQRNHHANGKKAELDAARDEAIPPEYEDPKLREDWSERKQRGVNLWDYLGCDVVVNGR